MAQSPKGSSLPGPAPQPQGTAAPPRVANGAAPQPTGASPASPPPLLNAGAAAPHFASVAFPSEPLSITVVPLRRPEMFMQSHAVEYTEPGDLLHDVLNPPSTQSSRRTMWPLDAPQVLSTVSFPLKDHASRYLVGEMFRGTLVIHNSSPFEVRQISATAVANDPRNGKRTLLDFSDKVLAPFCTLESRLEGLDLAHEGRHSISVLVHYADPTRAGEMRNASRTVPVTVTHGTIAEDVQVSVLPPYFTPLGSRLGSTSASSSAAAALTDATGGGAVTGSSFAAAGDGEDDIAAMLEQRLQCTATLLNTSGGPLHLTEVVFKKSGGTQQTDVVTVIDICDTPKMLARDGLFLPGERRSFMFEVVVTPTPTSPLFGAYATGSGASVVASTGGSDAANRGVELGTLRWGWRRPNGDGGHNASRPFYRSINANASPPVPPLMPSTQPRAALTATMPNALTTNATASPLVVRFVSASPSPRVAEPCVVTLAVGNLSATRAVDVIALIQADRLLPRFAFSGLTHMHVGLIAPRSVATLQLELLPLLGGKNAIDGSCLELRDVLASNGAWGAAVWPEAGTNADDAASIVLCMLHVTTVATEDDSC